MSGAVGLVGGVLECYLSGYTNIDIDILPLCFCLNENQPDLSCLDYELDAAKNVSQLKLENKTARLKFVKLMFIGYFFFFLPFLLVALIVQKVLNSR